MNFKMLKTALLLTIALGTLGSLNSIQAIDQEPLGEGEHYLAYNIWFESPDRLSSINYKKGSMIPVGSKVSNVRIAQGRKPLIKFFVEDYGIDFTIQFVPKYHPGLTPQKYMERMITSSTMDELTEGMSEVEKSGIETGTLYDGMSKEAVLMAWGYPPEHRTATTKLPTWIYWTSRFVTKSLVFDSEGQLAQFRKW